MEEIKKEYQLTNEGISACIEQLNFLKNENLEEDEYALKICLSYEEALLNLQEHYGQNDSIFLKIYQKGKKINIELYYKGDNFNPLIAKEDLKTEEGLQESIFQALGTGIAHKYNKNKNVIYATLTKKRKMSLTAMLLIGAIIGIIIGIIGRSLPKDIIDTTKLIITPIASAILGFIKMMSFPIIFLSIISGIIGCGNITTFGKMGKRTVLSFFSVMSLLEIATVIVLLSVFKIDFLKANKGVNFLQMFIDTIFNMFPNNIVKPFVEENCVQIVFISIMIGCAILILGKKGEIVSDFCNQLNEACKMILNWFCSFIPILVAILLAKSIWDGDDLVKCITVWKAVVIEFVVLIILMFLMMFRIKKATKLSFADMFKFVMPATIKAFSTGSTYCAYSDIINSAEKNFKVKKSEVEFYAAIGVSFFKTSFTMYSVIVFYFAYISNVPISLSWIFSFIIINILFSVSTPSVAGGGVAILAILFEIFVSNQSPYFGVASSLLVIMDFFTTAFRVLLMVLEIKILGIKGEKEAKIGQKS